MLSCRKKLSHKTKLGGGALLLPKQRLTTSGCVQVKVCHGNMQEQM